jgi:hypothetical protein
MWVNVGGAKEGIIPQPREIWFRSIHSLTDVRLPAGWVGGKLANVVAVVLRIIQPTLLVDSSIYCWGLHHKFLLHLLPTNGSGIPWIHTNIYALAVFFAILFLFSCASCLKTTYYDYDVY